MHRILYVVGQLGVGGLERQLYYLVRGINRERYGPAVAVWNFDQAAVNMRRIRSLGVSVYPLSENVSRHKKIYELRRLVGEVKPEVIHSYSFFTNFAAWWASLGSSAISVGSIRNNFLSERVVAGRLVGRLSARWPRVHISNSRSAQISVVQTQGPWKPSRTYVVPNAIDVADFPEPTSWPTKPVLLAVGRPYPEKRWDRLINVVGLVHQMGIPLRVYHAGAGPLAENLKAQARRMGLEKLITFLGLRQDMGLLFRESAFLIHTADDEGCPNVVMEAMANARAVVATDAGDVAQLVEDGRTGFVVKRGDDQLLADRVATLLRDPALARKFGENGRMKAQMEFNLDRLASDTLHVYRSLGWVDSITASGTASYQAAGIG